MNRALFLDRDGVINEDYGYVHKIEDFHFRDGIFNVCRSAQKARMKIIIVTNQAGIGRGYYGLEAYNRLTQYMLQTFSSEQISISDVYYCPFHPEKGIDQYKKESFCRKPNPGMLVKACSDHNINPRQSAMIGDKSSDRDAANALGIPFYVDASSAGWANKAILLLPC